MALLRLTRLSISEKSATYTIKWSYTFIWQVRVFRKIIEFSDKISLKTKKRFQNGVKDDIRLWVMMAHVPYMY